MLRGTGARCRGATVLGAKVQVLGAKGQVPGARVHVRA
jgi:hypothetical protein